MPKDSLFDRKNQLSRFLTHENLKRHQTQVDLLKREKARLAAKQIDRLFRARPNPLEGVETDSELEVPQANLKFKKLILQRQTTPVLFPKLASGNSRNLHKTIDHKFSYKSPKTYLHKQISFKNSHVSSR